MLKLNQKKQINLFTALCCAVYFTSYLTRKNYDAALVEIYTTMAIPKTLAGLASTGAVITYGAGQLLSGVLGDKFKPKHIITAGLVVTSVCNFILPLCGSIYPMIAVWCVNGLAQAMMWPPLVRIMSEALDENNYKKGVLRVTIACSCSTILVYVLIPLCIRFSQWKTAFFICSASAVAICFVWIFGMKAVERFTGVIGAGKKAVASNGENVKELKNGYIFAAGLIPISIGIILQGTLRDGVTTWMPSIVSEVYNLGTSVSIFSTVALPLLSIVSSTAASALQRKLKNEVLSALILFVVSAVSAVLLIAFNSSIIASILFMAIITACMHGINLMLVCEVPNYFAAYGKVSTISGILNSFTYVGSAISIYGIAAIAEKASGWTVNFIIWALISAFGSLFCLLAMKKWKKFKSEQ